MRGINFFYLILGVSLICGCEKKTNSGEMQTFRLDEVQLLDGPFLDAQQTDLDYIMQMDVDRLLAPYLVDAGFEPIKPGYGNWEGSGLNGHIGGHYLSALAMMYAATHDERVLTRLNYMIDWLAKCQKQNGNGYLGGIPDGKRVWNEVAKGEINVYSFSLNGTWVPIYNIHKLFAGLRDAYLFTGNEEAKAIWIALSDWWIVTVGGLTDEQIQRILISEHGGLNEVFADLYAETNAPQYLKMAERLSHQKILNPLLQHEDSLTGIHANTQIPKVIGFERISELNGNEQWSDAAAFFWNTVVENRTISIGGNSVREHFHSSDDFTEMLSSEQGPETCNTYNMLRLSKMLFLKTEDQKYLDYYERAQYNHILSSQHPDGGFVYFTPARPRHYRVYSQPDQGMWCCVGSGLENHTKYGELIYMHRDDDVFVNLFIASSLTSESLGIKLEQRTTFPESNTSEITVSVDQDKTFALYLRQPKWAGMSILVNDKTVSENLENGYLKIDRKWSNGDVVKINFDVKMTMEYLPDGSSWASFIYGPIVLAAISDSLHLDGLMADDSRMGHVAQGEFYKIDQVPMIAGDSIAILSNLEKSESAVSFTLAEGIFSKTETQLKLVPFYKVHDVRYSFYFFIADSLTINNKIALLKEDEERRIALKAITIDYVAPGEQQSEVEHGFKENKSYSGYTHEKYWRSGDDWFSYDLQNYGGAAKTLRITFDANTFQSYKLKLAKVDASVKPKQEKEGKELIHEYSIEEFNQRLLTISFHTAEGGTLPRVLDVRLITR
jgi:uncharacterized protein